jgi:hypothetical protein
VPTAPLAGCLEPGCPGRAVHRGYCERHRRTTTERGYGSAHQRERAAALPGAICEACGCTRNLQRDHRIPISLGGDERASNKRWLCRCPEHGCHDRLGMRSDKSDRSVDFVFMSRIVKPGYAQKGARGTATIGSSPRGSPSPPMIGDASAPLHRGVSTLSDVRVAPSTGASQVPHRCLTGRHLEVPLRGREPVWSPPHYPAPEGPCICELKR